MNPDRQSRASTSTRYVPVRGSWVKRMGTEVSLPGADAWRNVRTPEVVAAAAACQPMLEINKTRACRLRLHHDEARLPRYGRAVAFIDGRSEMRRNQVASCRRLSVRSPKPRLRAYSRATARMR
jgi:hypothetical protein